MGIKVPEGDKKASQGNVKGFKTLKLIIPGELPTLNEIIAKSKSHWGGYSSMKRRDTNRVAAEARKQKIGKFDKVNLVFYWYCENRRIDKDNRMAGQKFVIDGLVKAGVIKNDGWKEIGDVSHCFAVDRDNPRIEIELEGVE